MQYGTFSIQLFRVWDIKMQHHVPGVSGRTRRQATRELEDWLYETIGPRDTPEYRKARRNYRISQVQVSLSDSPINHTYEFKAGELTAVVVQGRNWIDRLILGQGVR